MVIVDAAVDAVETVAVDAIETVAVDATDVDADGKTSHTNPSSTSAPPVAPAALLSKLVGASP